MDDITKIKHIQSDYIANGKSSKTEDNNSLEINFDSVLTDRDIININDNRGQCYTVTEYDKYFSKWNNGTDQRKVADIWDNQGRKFKNGIASVNVNGVDRYLVATTTKFGKTGDLIDIVLDNGTTIKAVLADIKDPNDSNWTEDGHIFQGTKSEQINVLEWEVDSSFYEKYANPSSDNGYNIPWDSKSPVKTIKNSGSIL